MTTLEKLYILDWDVSCLGDDIYAAELMKFPDWENTCGLVLTEEYLLPQKVSFEANFQTISTMDFPYNDVRWPIMSERMLDILLSVKHFPHKSIPIVMINDSIMSKDRYQSNGLANDGVENHNFYAVQLTSSITALDYERSKYESDLNSMLIIDVERLILKEPREGFPPLFRISEYPAPLLVSSLGRLALESIEARGMIFTELENQ
jgi:hypothetical protein